MAIIEVVVPQLSESVAEATLLTWNKTVGQTVTRDENLIDVETDKVVLELPAPASGVLVEIIEADGATVAAGQLIAKIDTEAVAGAAAPEATASVAATTVAGAAPITPVATPTTVNAASPAATKIMAEKGLGAVAGTGKDGRITKGDAIAASNKAPASSIPAPAAGATLPAIKAPISVESILADRPEQRVPMSRLRARVAERLLQSQSTNAILTTFNEVNMAPVMEMRNKYKDKFEKEHGVKLGFMGFFQGLVGLLCGLPGCL